MNILDIDPADIPLPDTFPPNENSGESLVWLIWVLLAITTVVLGARLASKLLVLKRFAIDDVLMIIAWAMTVGYSAVMQMGYHHGMGRHYIYLNIQKSYNILVYEYAGQVLSVAGPAFSRTAFGLYLIALMGRARTSLRWLVWGTLALHAVFNVVLIIVLWCACGFDMPIILNPATTCFRHSPWSNYAHWAGAFNAFTDLILTLVPAILVFRLRTTMRAKWAATALLGLSSLAMVSAVWRTIEIDDIFVANWDFAHDTVPYFWASSLEQNIIILTASIPTLGPLFQHLRRSYDSRISTTKSATLSSSHPRASGDSFEIQHNLAHALGIHMPGLGNHVVITGGQGRRKGTSGGDGRQGEDDELPLTDMGQAIKTTVRTDVKVDTLEGGEEDEKGFAKFGRY